MALNKLTYVDNVTVIPASNLNEIQDAIIDLEENSGNSVPTNVRQAIYTLLNSGAYATTGLTDEIAIVESWASEVTSLSLSASTLTLNEDTPQTLVATTVPTGSAVVWSSSDTTIATVVGGVVTGVSNGSCTITASAGDLSATCSVTVSGFAVLESISAVYTQSGTVYDIDSLDSLKADLVVTATYSDSTTETVPSTDYTLSGTLEAGTSTITVSYSGKTTTFSVTVTSWKDKMSYSTASGDLDVQNLATSWDSTHGLYVSAVTNNKRRCFTLPYGERSCRYTTDNTSYTDTSEYYPIPIPSSATSVTVSISPSTMYHGESFYTLANDEYTRQADPGWKQGSFTHTFTAGQYEFMAIACKKDSSGNVFTTEPELTITFA